jgi:glycosyltransferase involved in cell wall biosynthesis
MKKSEREKVVSILIPAYNRPEYLRKTLQSIVELAYRPLEVVLSDDCSPRSLELVAKEFADFEDDLFAIKYYRQQSNLGVMDNFAFTLEQATGRYVVPFAHDNTFVDGEFISEAVEIMSRDPKCNFCVANAIYENTGKQMLKLPEDIDAKDSWVVLEGDKFIRLWRRGGLGWTQAVILDKHIAQSLGAFEEPFLVSETIAQKFNLAADNAFAYVFVLSSVGSVGLSGKVVCEIGTPDDSYSRSDPRWSKNSSKAKFVIFYNIYRANLKGEYARDVKEMARKQALQYIDNIADLKILQYYNYSRDVIFLVCHSLLRRPSVLMERARRRMKAFLGISKSAKISGSD